jgi:acyl-CoA synthetase (AMP-forming)/AMP-acid ligase II
MYGLTECKRVAYLPPEEIDRRPLSVGRAMPDVEAYLVDECGRRLACPASGELVVRGANVMVGYWNRPEDTERVLRPGPVPGERVLYTGDIFRTDGAGFLYFVGRTDDILKSRGRKVSPREVENVLYSLDGVLEAAVIGRADATLGEMIMAWVVVKPGHQLTERDVLRHCAAHLEDYMVPHRVCFTPSFEKTSSGKIDKRRIAAEES